MLKQSAQKIQDVLHERGLTYTIKQYPQSTRTADDAARAIGCDVGAIVKTLVFKTNDGSKRS